MKNVVFQLKTNLKTNQFSNKLLYSETMSLNKRLVTKNILIKQFLVKEYKKLKQSKQQQQVLMSEKSDSEIQSMPLESVSFDENHQIKENNALKQKWESLDKNNRNSTVDYQQFQSFIRAISSLLDEKIYEQARIQIKDFLQKHQQQKFQMSELIVLQYLLQFLPFQEKDSSLQMIQNKQKSSQSILEKFVLNLKNNHDPLKNLKVKNSQQKENIQYILNYIKSEVKKRAQHLEESCSEEKISHKIIQKIQKQIEVKWSQQIKQKTRIIRILLNKQQQLQKAIEDLEQTLQLERYQMIGIKEFEVVVKQLEQIQQKFQKQNQTNSLLLQENANLKILISYLKKNNESSLQNGFRNITQQREVLTSNYRNLQIFLNEYKQNNEQISAILINQSQKNTQLYDQLKKQSTQLQQRFQKLQKKEKMIENLHLNKSKQFHQQEILEINPEFKRDLSKKEAEYEISILKKQKSALEEQNKNLRQKCQRFIEGFHELERENEDTNWKQKYISMAILNSTLIKKIAEKPQRQKEGSWKQKYHLLSLELKNFKQGSRVSNQTLEKRLTDTKKELEQVRHQYTLVSQQVNTLSNQNDELKIKNSDSLFALQKRQKQYQEQIYEFRKEKQFFQQILNEKMKEYQNFMKKKNEQVEVQKKQKEFLRNQKESDLNNFLSIERQYELKNESLSGMINNLQEQNLRLKQIIQNMTEEKNNLQNNFNSLVNEAQQLENKVNEFEEKQLEYEQRDRSSSRQLKVLEQKSQAESDQYLYIIKNLEQKVKSQSQQTKQKNQQLQQLRKQFIVLQQIVKQKQSDFQQQERKIEELANQNFRYQQQIVALSKIYNNQNIEGSSTFSNKRPKTQETYFPSCEQELQERDETKQIEVLSRANTELASLAESNYQLKLKIALLENYTKQLNQKSADTINYFLILQEKMERLFFFLVQKKYLLNDERFRQFLIKANCYVMKVDDEEYLGEWLEFMKELFMEVFQKKERELQQHKNQRDQLQQRINKMSRDELVSKPFMNGDSHELNNYKMVITDVRFLLTEYLRSANPQVLKIMSESLGLIDD